jgi:hypothetical protein
MRISRRNLQSLIENYLREQEDDTMPEEGEDDKASSEGEESDTPEEAENESSNISDIQPFSIEIDGEKKEISFFKDDNSLKYKIDGVVANNKTPQNFVTLASLGMLVDDQENLEDLAKIVDLDVTMKKYSTERKIQAIQQKMKTERPGMSVEDIRKAVQV